MSNFLKARRVEIFVVVAIIAIVGVVYALTRESATAPTITQNTQQQQNVISYEGQDGRNALDLLRVFHQVETKDTSFGPQIMGIDGVKPGESEYWAFYVDGKQAQVGAHQYVTKKGEKIEWKIESF